MYCQNCGKYLPDTAKFCDDCGMATLLGSKLKETASEVFPDTDYNEDPEKSPKRVGLSEAVRLYLKNTFNFSGRSTNSEFWFVMLFHFIIMMAIGIIMVALGSDFEPTHPDAESIPVDIGTLILVYVVYLAVNLIPSISLVVRRLHDSGKSGLWLIPAVVFPFVLFVLFAPSAPANKWGLSADEKKQMYYRRKGEN